jgi:hypothetical protein
MDLTAKLAKDKKSQPPYSFVDVIERGYPD